MFSCSSLLEPTSVDIHVDGINDICTKGGDINFVFTGFSVNGKVRLFLYLFIPFHVNCTFIKMSYFTSACYFYPLVHWFLFILTGPQQRSGFRSCWSPGCTEKCWQWCKHTSNCYPAWRKVSVGIGMGIPHVFIYMRFFQFCHIGWDYRSSEIHFVMRGDCELLFVSKC